MNSGGDGFSRNRLVRVGVTQVKAAVWHMLLAGSVQLSSQQTQGDISRGPDLTEGPRDSFSLWENQSCSITNILKHTVSELKSPGTNHFVKSRDTVFCLRESCLSHKNRVCNITNCL